jgi:hypothetical protein
VPQNIGPHLLGRIPSPPDERDYRLENFKGVAPTAAAAIDGAAVTAELRQTTVTFARWAATKYPDVTQTHWWKALYLLGQISPTPPAPPDPTADVRWLDAEPVLDQGDFGTCVGNAWAQFGNTDPVDDKFTEGTGQSATQGGPYARAIYYEATVLDGSPDDPDAPGGGQQGATTRSGVKAMKNRGRISVYAFASTIDEIRNHLRTVGPVVVGTDWTNDMFTPTADGYLKPTGGVAGGHEWVLSGDLPGDEAFEMLNSWGDSWGNGGHAKIKWADFQTLLDQQGEAVATVELP